MAEIVAQTERLILRKEAEGDREAWMAHINTAQVTQHLGGPRTAEEVDEKFDKMARGWETDGYSFMFMELREGGIFLGTCGMTPLRPEHTPPGLAGEIQIGWQMRADYWGQGYATEAAQAVVAMAFERHEAEILYSQTSSRNEPSWRIMERLGMRRRPELDYDDAEFSAEENPTILYSLSRAEWDAAQAGARGRIAP